jgi:hypothetical protein
VNHGHTQTHKTHHDLNLEEATTFPLIVFSMINHGGYIQMSFCPKTPKLGVPKFSKLGLPRLCRPITFCENFQLKGSSKQNYSPCRELSNNMLHATWTQVNQGDSWLLVVESQIDTLTPSPSFGCNLCFKYSNEMCEPILHIYVPTTFQRYKKLFNPMSFVPCNYSLKIQKSIGTPIPKVGAHLGMCGFICSHPPILPIAWNVTPRLHSRPTPLQALALVTSSKLKLRQRKFIF